MSLATASGCFAEFRTRVTRTHTTDPTPDVASSHGLGWRLGLYLGFYLDPAPTKTLAAVSWPVYNWHFIGRANRFDGVRDHDPEFRADVGLGHPSIGDVHKRITIAGAHGTSDILHIRDGEDTMQGRATQTTGFVGLTFDWRLSPGYVLNEGGGITIGPSYTSITSDTLGSMTTVGLEIRMHMAITPLTWVLATGGLCKSNPQKCREIMKDYEPTVITPGPTQRHEECTHEPGPNGSTTTVCRMVE